MSDIVWTFRWKWRGWKYNYFILTSDKNIYGILYPGEIDRGTIEKTYHSLYHLGILSDGEYILIGDSDDFKIMKYENELIATFKTGQFQFRNGEIFKYQRLDLNNKIILNINRPREQSEIIDNQMKRCIIVITEDYGLKIILEKIADLYYLPILIMACIYIYVKRREEAFVYSPTL